MMALNPLLKSLVERSRANELMREVVRLEADLRLAKAEVKAARLEIRLHTARRAWAEAEAEADRHPITPEANRIAANF